jgi:NADH-quinone oxidoreductase subunit M
MLFGFPLISLVIWLPIFAGIGVLATGGDRNAHAARWLALAGSIAGFLVAIPLYTQFDPLVAGMQFVEHRSWIERFNIYYHLGIDGIAMPLILLNFFTNPLVVIAGWKVISRRVYQYMGAFLIM